MFPWVPKEPWTAGNEFSVALGPKGLVCGGCICYGGWEGRMCVGGRGVKRRLHLQWVWKWERERMREREREREGEVESTQQGFNREQR